MGELEKLARKVLYGCYTPGVDDRELLERIAELENKAKEDEGCK